MYSRGHVSYSFFDFFSDSRVVFIMAVSIFNSSLLSWFKLLNAALSIYPLSYKSSSQYSVSPASARAIFILAIKAGLDCAKEASFAFAPILIPDLTICFEITNSLFSLRK